MKNTTVVKKRSTRINKPLIEKKRRDRINTCLNQLKGIILQSKQNEIVIAPHKLEKADILELTVQHVKDLVNIDKQDNYKQERDVDSCYLSGFRSCIKETMNHIETETELSDLQKWQLVNSLNQPKSVSGSVGNEILVEIIGNGVQSSHELHERCGYTSCGNNQQINYPCHEALEENALKNIADKSQDIFSRSEVDNVSSDKFSHTGIKNTKKVDKQLNIIIPSKEGVLLSNQDAKRMSPLSNQDPRRVEKEPSNDADNDISYFFSARNESKAKSNEALHENQYLTRKVQKRKFHLKIMQNNNCLKNYTHRKKEWICNYTKIMGAETKEPFGNNSTVGMKQPVSIHVQSSVWRPW